MKRSPALLSAVLCGAALLANGRVEAQDAATAAATRLTFTGMDRNDYPGDSLLGALHRSFAFTGYWLNAPPGETANSWAGKRNLLRERGFGFAVLWNGKLDKDLKGKDAASLGRADAAAAVASAMKEGFPKGTLVFLDQEEGGRLFPEQLSYILGFVDGMRRAGWRAGVYCSGIPVDDGNGSTVNTAQDLLRQAGSWKIPLWVARDECPPSPGCTILPKPPLPSAELGFPNAVLWQYALSPRRPEFTGGCPKNYDADSQCYAPGVYHGQYGFVDLDAADSSDPSGGR